MFLVIMFIVYFDYILSIARLSLYLCISSYSAHSKVPWVSGRYCISMVLICCLPMDTSLLYLSLLLYVCYNCYDNIIHIIYVPSYHVHGLL